MSVAVLERRTLCMEASGVNAGTLSIQIKRAALVPYALRGWELWKTTAERFGVDVGFHIRGGLTVAFDMTEAEILETRMAERRRAGAPIEIISSDRAREIEPRLSDEVVLASYCPLDGYANPSVTGLAYRSALRRAGAQVIEKAPVERIERGSNCYKIRSTAGVTTARRIVLASGAWLGPLAGMFGVSLPVRYRVNQVSVTERCPPLFQAMLGHATGLLTLKQSDNGTLLIGGGWQGAGDPHAEGPTQVVASNLVGNLRLACRAIPALVVTRLVRTWHGFEAHVPDFMPLVGALPGHPEAFVIGCVRGGYTIGPYMGRLLAARILGREPEMPLFDPGRFAGTPAVETASIQEVREDMQ